MESPSPQTDSLAKAGADNNRDTGGQQKKSADPEGSESEKLPETSESWDLETFKAKLIDHPKRQLVAPNMDDIKSIAELLELSGASGIGMTLSEQLAVDVKGFRGELEPLALLRKSSYVLFRSKQR